MTATALYDYFVSYADDDRAWVEGYLLDALAEAGLRCHSESAFALGVPRLIEFERAIMQSRWVLIVLSPAYLSDTFAQFANLLAQSFGLETNVWPVIPLILKPVALPLRLSNLKSLPAIDPHSRADVVRRLCEQLKRPPPDDAAALSCPYPGMLPFAEADSDRFFGRERAVRELVQRLRLHPFLTVIGPSGSGKSSLVFAGLLPALRASTLFGAGQWLVRTMRPGGAPLQALAAALSGDPEDLGAIRLFSGDAARLMLVVDQFEETFTVAGEECARFQQALVRLGSISGCFVVLTVRADFYADLMVSSVWELVRDHRFEVVPLNSEGLRQAIVLPAERQGVAIETALTERLLADASGEPGVLPLIQETLVLLWDHLERRCLPLHAYESLVDSSDDDTPKASRTGIQVAMARRADAALAALAPTQQAIAHRIFLRLIQFGEGRADTRRQQPVDALRAADDDRSLFDQTLQWLAASRLLTLSAGVAGAHSSDLQTLVDISHEALIGGWPMLQRWLAERREAEQTRRRLEDKAAEWVRMGRGAGGLLDAAELPEAERWLAGSDAADLGYDAALADLAQASRAALDTAEREREAARARELAQANALLAAERRGRRWLQGLVGVLSALMLAFAGFLAWPYALSLVARGEMVTIPAGKVGIGTSQADAFPEEQPAWQTTLAAFWIERYEVSNRQYGMCVAARVCSVPDDPIQYADPQLAEHPVVGVTAIQASEYCRWLGRRLPTELEWERAARGVAPGREWPWGNTPLAAERANVWIEAEPQGSEPVNSHPKGASPEGVFDLIGNVWEWTSSFRQEYSHYDERQVWDGSSLDILTQHNLIYRGGGWQDTMERVTLRRDSPGNLSAPSIGMRCASDA